MIDVFWHVNWLAVLVASLAHFGLAGAWFAGLMARPYVYALGIADRPAQKQGSLFLVGPLLCSALTISTSAVLLLALGITSYGRALELGAVVGIGYLAAMTVNIAINPLFPRPFLYAAINAPFFVMGSLASCAILVAMS